MSDKLTKVDNLLDVERQDRLDKLMAGDVDESHIVVPQKVYKPIDRLSRGLKIIKKLKEKANEEATK